MSLRKDERLSVGLGQPYYRWLGAPVTDAELIEA